MAISTREPWWLACIAILGIFKGESGYTQIGMLFSLQSFWRVKKKKSFLKLATSRMLSKCNRCSLNYCRQRNLIVTLYTEFFNTSKAITVEKYWWHPWWVILSYAGLLLSSTAVAQIYDPYQRKDQYLTDTMKERIN